jgi:hypothetical protein
MEDCYYRARYYEPATGRFLSEDPNVIDAPRSLFGYARNSPAVFTDWSGWQNQTPNLEPGVDGKSGKAIAIGFEAALNRLKGGDCTKLFGDPCEAKKKLGEMKWGVFTETKRPGVLAHTTETHLETEFNTAGEFFGVSGYWMSPSSHTTYFFGNQSSLLAFVILHELAHHFSATGFKADGPGIPNNNSVNESNSLLLINACFKDARRIR